MVLRVLNLETLTSCSQRELAGYGGKTAGVVHLRRMQPQAPVPYRVPSAFAIPGRSRGDYEIADIREQFDRLRQGWSDRTVIMTRSSAFSEDHEPGKNPTFLSVYDP